jgi:uncharacterized membrane protein YoaK (UPF0700 family)
MPETSCKPDASSELRSARGMFIIAMLFTIAGGFMDAYSYLALGHVFANAQTGNIVLFAVYSSGGEWQAATRTIPPIVAYVAGIAVGNLLGATPRKRTFHATLICQALELFVLAALWGCGRWVVDIWAVPMMSFCSALQNASFSQINSWSFNSSMTTGNIRRAVTSFVYYFQGKEPEASRNQAIVASAVAVCFAGGAILGAWLTRRLEFNALGICVCFVVAGMVATLRERGRSMHRSHAATAS